MAVENTAFSYEKGGRFLPIESRPRALLPCHMLQSILKFFLLCLYAT